MQQLQAKAWSKNGAPNMSGQSEVQWTERGTVDRAGYSGQSGVRVEYAGYETDSTEWGRQDRAG